MGDCVAMRLAPHSLTVRRKLSSARVSVGGEDRSEFFRTFLKFSEKYSEIMTFRFLNHSEIMALRFLDRSENGSGGYRDRFKRYSENRGG